MALGHGPLSGQPLASLVAPGGVALAAATSQAQSSAATVGVSMDSSAATAQAQRVAGQLAGLLTDSTGATSQAQRTQAVAGVSSSVAVAASQAQRAAAKARVTTPHRYWRINVSANNGAADFCAMGEVELFTDVGVDLTGAGTASSSSTRGSSYNAAKAFDNDEATVFVFASPWAGDGWLKYDFGSPKAVLSVGLRPPAVAGYAQAAAWRDWQLQWSDDNATWTTAWTVAGATDWGGPFRRVYDADGLVTPAAADTDSATHRFWRVRVDQRGTSGCEIAEIELHSSMGGVDQSGAGSAYASTYQSYSSYPASGAFDNGSGRWRADTGSLVPEWIAYDFGVGTEKNIVEFKLTNVAAARMPRALTFQYSDDGVSWTTKWAVSGVVWTTNGQSKTFSMNGASAATSQAQRAAGAIDLTLGAGVTTAQAQRTAAVAGAGAGAVAATSQASTVSALARAEVSGAATAQAQRTSATAGVATGSSSGTSQASTTAAQATSAWVGQVTSSQAQHTAGTAAVVTNGAVATSQAQTSAAGAAVPVGSSATSSQAQSVAGIAAVVSAVTVATSQAEGVAAVAGVALSVAGATSQAQKVAGQAGLDSPAVVATHQGNTTSATVGVLTVIQSVATSQAQHMAGIARGELPTETVVTRQAQSSTAAAALGLDVRAGSSQAQTSAAQAAPVLDLSVATKQAQSSASSARTEFILMAATSQAQRAAVAAGAATVCFAATRQAQSVDPVVGLAVNCSVATAQGQSNGWTHAEVQDFVDVATANWGGEAHALADVYTPLAGTLEARARLYPAVGAVPDTVPAVSGGRNRLRTAVRGRTQTRPQ